MSVPQGAKRKPPVQIKGIDAVLLDLDGVVTETASVHAETWKRIFDEYLKERAARLHGAFEPFDIADDYKRYVDGKPRLDGVASFLQSRGIRLPLGDPNDSPDKETIWGLGNRKNRLYLAAIRKNGVNVYPTSLEFIKKAKSLGLKIAVVTASRNCTEVLKSAGLEDLFDTQVDGNVARECKLDGKPAPDTYLEAARRLDTKPERTAVVEDATSGVRAGKAGHFGLVIGVSRGSPRDLLKRSGADVVVADLDELEFRSEDDADGATVPHALEQRTELRSRLEKRRAVVFLDYDGTLTPIVERPELAILSHDMRETLRRLADYCTVIVVSGRERQDVEDLVGEDNIFYAGSHGFDIAGPEGTEIRHEEGLTYLPEIARAAGELRRELAPIYGVIVENKTYALAVHFRMVREENIGQVEQIVDKVVAQHPLLRKTGGKKVFELRPNMDWDKGKAVLWLLDALGLNKKDVLPLYIGDDITDYDAFRALRGKGISILVSDQAQGGGSDYRLSDTTEVRLFLDALTAMLSGETKMSDWTLAYEGYDPKQEGLRESLCTLGNGYFATRGAAPDALADGIHYPGTYLAGGYNRLTSEIAGHTIENEDLVNIPNWLPLVIRIDEGPWLRPDDVEYLDYRQELDLREGLLHRFLRLRDSEGRTIRWDECRIVSMDNPHLAAIELRLTPEDWHGRITIRSALDGSVINSGVARYRQLSSRHLETIEAAQTEEDVILLRSRMIQCRREIVEAARTRVYREGEPFAVERHLERLPDSIAQDIIFDAEEGQETTIEKVISLYTSHDAAISEPGSAGLDQLRQTGPFETVLRAHRRAWAHLWSECGLMIENAANSGVQMKLHLHTFHLLQTVSAHSIDLDVGMPPRGWHGEAYRGHIMWDELFIFPYLTLRKPVLTRALLRYRHRRLGEARRLAREAGLRGAMFPWQSGSDGREESQSLHLNPISGSWIPDYSYRQRHINAAIAYNIWQYYEITEDRDFLYDFGAELMLDIARFLASLASYDEAAERYAIRGVMGPDEFHTAYPGKDPGDEGGLDNNAYTNVMVAWTLTRALDVLDLLPENRRHELCDQLELGLRELRLWDEISRNLIIPFHDDGVISQFDGYEDLEEFDWEGYRKKYGQIQRLDRILNDEGTDPNVYKVAKQADTLMLFFLFSTEELTEIFERLGYDFTPDMITKTIHYYVQRTSHGSTLSWVTHAWVLARSDRPGSWQLLCQSLDSDFADLQGGTTPEGIHLGAMAGTVDLIQRCYTGIEPRANVLTFNPRLPDQLTHLKTTVRYRGQTLDLEITQDSLRVTSRPFTAYPITIAYRGHVREVSPGQRYEFRLVPHKERDRRAKQRVRAAFRRQASRT